MLKHNLRDMGFTEQERIPKQIGITILWVILTISILSLTSIAIVWSVIKLGIGVHNAIDPLELITNTLVQGFGVFSPMLGVGMTVIFYLLLYILTYLAIKCLLTIIVCKDKNRSIKLKILKSKAMPICECKEALKVWQIVLIYVAPFILTYTLLFIFCIVTMAGAIYILGLVVLIFYGAFDLTLIIYVLRIKIKEKIDYISVDYHVYQMTLYSKTYIRAKKKRNNFY